jgi:peptidoglycan/xylan/chitin deacetylase (PgdA/CDA1 family)
MLDRGVLVISIDTELAWSVLHRGVVGAEMLDPKRVEAERDIVRDLLALFEAHDVSATWATVGHLFLDRCHPVDGRKHPEIRRPEYDWFEGDWFDLDPATDIDRDPMWYGTDIIEMIRRARPKQEIGSHSFSHLIVGDPGCSTEAFATDLAACRELASAIGVDLRSFVYPRNTIGHLEVLADQGFASYRGLRPSTFTGLGRWGRALARAVDRVRPLAGSIVLPERDGRLWNLPATNLYAPFDRARYLPFGAWVGQQARRLEQASRHGSLFHLWFHPHNLIDDPEQALSGLGRILTRASELRASGRLDNLTMDGLARMLDERVAPVDSAGTVANEAV